MFINSLLACFMLLTQGASDQCITDNQSDTVQATQDNDDDYIPTVIYFTSKDLSVMSQSPEIREIETISNKPEEDPIVQTFVIKR